MAEDQLRDRSTRIVAVLSILYGVLADTSRPRPATQSPELEREQLLAKVFSRVRLVCQYPLDQSDLGLVVVLQLLEQVFVDAGSAAAPGEPTDLQGLELLADIATAAVENGLELAARGRGAAEAARRLHDRCVWSGTLRWSASDSCPSSVERSTTISFRRN